jgi:hypothetical protein
MRLYSGPASSVEHAQTSNSRNGTLEEESAAQDQEKLVASSPVGRNREQIAREAVGKRRR